MNQQAAERLQIDQQLRGALDRGELNLVFQPIIHSRNRQLKGMEALIRWTNPELGRVTPAQFIPVAEQIGFISELGNWVLREACAQLASWQRRYERSLIMSINVSPRQFHEGTIIPAVKSTLAKLGLKAGALQIEVTENLLLNASERLVADLHTLKASGVRLALDDFGTGYSSLSYLQHLPFDVLKIDKSFINHIATRAQEEAMVGAIVNMGHSLGMTVVAEGVETAEQTYSLDQLGVDDLQGYYFAQPLSAREFEHRFLDGHLQTGTALDDSVWDRL
jgi:EAL domain-containing protein (putative c-di-GMP-specific phosphodiesterase class I)